MIKQLTKEIKPKAKLKDWVFKKVHTSNLVYNTCWEDPRCDRNLLQFDADSEIVMITSAGCNALDYLLDNPAFIHAIDMNPRQNALLELKKALISAGSFEDHFQFFGNGIHQEAKSYYKKNLQATLPVFAQDYWDKNIKYFDGHGPRSTFYHYGTAGTFAWLANRYFKIQKVKPKLQALLNATSLEEQAEHYYAIEDKLANGLMQWIVNRHLTMVLLGVPRSQQDLFMTKYSNGAMGFILECLRQVFTEISISDNYFWRLYVNGAYSRTCCPEYLKEENFDFLRNNIGKVNTYTSTISQFLKENPGKYSHFILLDHQDWLASNNVEALEEEWELILQNSRPGTQVLLRSASHEVDFFPDFVKERIMFNQELSDEWHKKDRVGTYASVYVGTVVA